MDVKFEFLGRASENAGEKLFDGLLADIKSLEEMLYRSPVYNRSYLPVGKYRYMVSCERYRIVYQIGGNMVLDDDIQDCRKADSHSLFRGGGRNSVPTISNENLVNHTARFLTAF